MLNVHSDLRLYDGYYGECVMRSEVMSTTFCCKMCVYGDGTACCKGQWSFLCRRVKCSKTNTEECFFFLIKRQALIT